ncbi:hypothetical protein U2H31_006523 [Pseudomonas aeruginosa]|nr:hypothetical protein [Pseudomonas aeruginosa]
MDIIKKVDDALESIEAHLLVWVVVLILLFFAASIVKTIFLVNMAGALYFAGPLFCLLGLISTSGIYARFFSSVTVAVISASILVGLTYFSQVHAATLVNLSTGLPASDLPYTTKVVAVGILSQLVIIFVRGLFLYFAYISISRIYFKYEGTIRRWLLGVVLAAACWLSQLCFGEVYLNTPSIIRILALEYDAITKHGCDTGEMSVRDNQEESMLPVVYSTSGRVYAFISDGLFDVVIKDVQCKWVDPLR